MKRHCSQKVLLKMDRNNITPSYLRKLRAVVLRTMAIRFRRGSRRVRRVRLNPRLKSETWVPLSTVEGAQEHGGKADFTVSRRLVNMNGLWMKPASPFSPERLIAFDES